MALVCGSMFILFYRFCVILSTGCFAVVLCKKNGEAPLSLSHPSPLRLSTSSPSSRGSTGGPWKGLCSEEVSGGGERSREGGGLQG